MKVCYVSMAFGRKSDAQGRSVDYDRVYRELIVPAAQAAGLACQRADEFAGALIHKDIVKAVITSDVMLADVSNGNPNVMYELGIRHALRRGATVLLTSTQLPFNIAHSYALRYAVADDGGLDAAALDATLAQLTDVLRDKAERLPSDSPLYEYFPELRVDLPSDLQPPEMRRRAYPAQAQGAAVRGADRKTAVARAEQVTRSTADVDPQAFLDLLRRYLNLGAMDDVLRLAAELPPDVAALPQVAQAVALAQGRLGNTDAAIEVLRQAVAGSGGDPETRGLLGSLYKKRHLSDGSNADLEAAIEQYRIAFEGNRQDLYLGRNLVQLLHRKGGSAAADELKRLLPELRNLARHGLADAPPDYWLLDSALILAVIDADAPAADELVEQMLALRPEAWMREATRTELQGVQARVFDIFQRERLRSLMARLDAPHASGDVEEDDDAQL